MIIELRVSWSPLSTNLTATIPSALGVVSNDVVGPACFGGVGVRCCRLGDHVARSSRLRATSTVNQTCSRPKRWSETLSVIPLDQVLDEHVSCWQF